MKGTGDMRPTKKQLAARLVPHKAYGNKWFYLAERSGQDLSTCSFHDGETGQAVFGIHISVLLRALERTGFLDQWDRENQILQRLDVMKRNSSIPFLIPPT